MLTEKPWNLRQAGRLFLGVIAAFCLGSALAGFLFIGSTNFSSSDVRDMPGLVMQWREQANPLSAFLWQKFSDSQKLVFKNFPPSASPTNQAQDVVVQALNKIIAGPNIYESERFKNIPLQAKTLNLLKQNPTESNLKRLNRLLLEDAWPSHLSNAQSDFWQIVIAATFLEVPALILIALFLRKHAINYKDAFGFGAGERATVMAYGVMAGALFVPVAWGLNELSGKLMDLLHLNAQDQQIVQEIQDPGLSVAEKFFLGALAIAVAPVVEEMLFRGILYPAIKQRGWPGLALWGTSALFALVHANMASFVPLMLFAVVLVRLYETFGNLLAPIVAHSLFNAANFLALVYQEQINRFLHLT